MALSTQIVLEDEKVILYPLQEADFEGLYAVASDPEIWKQHPNKDRWKREVFQVFFEGALRSGGAYRIVDKLTGDIAGSTRMYDYNPQTDTILIGYTFFATRFWGKGYNPAVKKLMLDYLFQYVSTVEFQIGAVNVRSQIAITRLGAVKMGELEIAYFGEAPKLNFIYHIQKADWQKNFF